MKRAGIAAALLALLVGLTACTSAADKDGSSVHNSSDCGSEDNNPCSVTLIYEGKPLHCVSWKGSHSEIGYTCDWVAYHGLTENPVED